MTADKKVLLAIDCLKHAIDDSQQTIRGYDSKAEVLAVLLTLAIGLTNFNLYADLSAIGKYILMVAWLFSLVAIWMLGLVLYPQKNQFKSIRMGTFTPKGTYYLHSLNDSPENTVAAIAVKVLDTSWVEELTYEVMKLSVIRDKKHNWFLRALRLTAIALLLIIITLIFGLLCDKNIS